MFRIVEILWTATINRNQPTNQPTNQLINQSINFYKSLLTENTIFQDGYIEFGEFLQALSVTSRGSVQEKLQCKHYIYNLFFFRSFSSLLTMICLS
jgi:Ca2+-binding EF-hand superfamily protein